MNYATFAFSDAIKKLQEINGSRNSYARMEQAQYIDGLTSYEEDFIRQRDHFYMASIGENGYPYIQHRGGPRGFIVVLDKHTLGIVDFSGNKQYISVGNVQANPHVALFLVDYPAKARLKMYADIRIVELKDDPELFKRLDPAGYKHQPERMMLFDIKAYDWNCPQHITPRYTVEEIEQAFRERNDYVKQLETELARLRQKLHDDTDRQPQ